MEEEKQDVQVQMIWPKAASVSPSAAALPAGFEMRRYRAGDEPAFFRLMARAGWTGWDGAKLRPWLYRILPQGWLMVTEPGSDRLLASAMATHDPTWRRPFCGEMGWVATDPAYRGQGLGTAVVAAATNRFLAMGYECIHLYTEIWRLPALHIYLKLGYTPLLDGPEAEMYWQEICASLARPFTPHRWPRL